MIASLLLLIFLTSSSYAINNTKLDLKTLAILVSEELNVSILMSSELSSLEVDFVLQDYTKSDLYSMFEKFIISKNLKIHKFNKNSMFISLSPPQNKQLFIFKFRYITPAFFLNSINPYFNNSISKKSSSYKSKSRKSKVNQNNNICSISLNSLVCFITEDDYKNILSLKDVLDVPQIFLKYTVYLVTFNSLKVKSFDYGILTDTLKVSENSLKFLFSCFLSSCTTTQNLDFNLDFKNRNTVYQTLYENSFYSLINKPLIFSLTDTKRLVNSSYTSSTDGVRNDYEDKKVGFDIKINSTIINNNLYNISLDITNSFFNDDIISSQNLTSNFLLKNNKTIVISDFKKIQTLSKKDNSLYFDFLAPFFDTSTYDTTSLILKVERLK